MAAIEIPTGVGFTSKNFDIGFAQQLTPAGTQGFIQTVNRTSPFWVAELQSNKLDRDVENEARTFFDALEGSMYTFLGWDPKRVMPYAYRTQSLASIPWGAAPTITAQNYAASTIALGSMDDGAIVTKGDYISVQIGGIWYLFRALQTRVAASNVITDLLVKPRPQIVSFATTAIRYKKACIEMKVMGKVDWEDRVDDFASFSFRAAQFTARAAI